MTIEPLTKTRESRLAATAESREAKLAQALRAIAGPPDTLHALLAATSLSTKTMREGADAVPDLHAALGAWRN